MPAFANSRFGALGSKLADGTIVCCFSRKKSKKDCLISNAFMIQLSRAEPRRCAKNRGRSSERYICGWAKRSCCYRDSYQYGAFRTLTERSGPRCELSCILVNEKETWKP